MRRRQSVEERADAQDSAIDFGCLPFTVSEAEKIKDQLHQISRGPTEQATLDRHFETIREAALSLEVDLDIAEAPLRPKTDWRPRLRRLKRYRSGLRRILFPTDEDPDKRLEAGDLALLLYHGLAMVGSDPGPDWRKQLLASDALLGQAIDALLANPIVLDLGGREPDEALLSYLDVIADVYVTLSGKPLGRSVSYSANDPEKSGKPRGPALRLMRLCTPPLLPWVTDQYISSLIRVLQQRRR